MISCFDNIRKSSVDLILGMRNCILFNVIEMIIFNSKIRIYFVWYMYMHTKEAVYDFIFDPTRKKNSSLAQNKMNEYGTDCKFINTILISQA